MAGSGPKFALVTGAAGVLGSAITRTLMEDGYRVAMVDVDRQRLEGLKAEFGEGALPVVMDIGDAEKVARNCEELRKNQGEITVLINNAGVLSNNKVLETTPGEWRQIMAANLDGPFYLCREWLPGMKKAGWGRIVNICSLAMKTGGLTAGTTYAASKGGLASLTFSIAREVAPHGITVNGIAPAYINTPMVTEHLTPEQRERLLEQIPVGRFCDAPEVAHVVRFLVSPLSGFITGEIIDVNGGLHMD